MYKCPQVAHKVYNTNTMISIQHCYKLTIIVFSATSKCPSSPSIHSFFSLPPSHACPYPLMKIYPYLGR
eukprot:c29388_g3_i1 orf=128-334(+)